MEKKEYNKPNIDFPNQETKYQQVVEEMKQLIPFLKGEMKNCPIDDLVFNLIETVDFYSLKRNFNFKSKSSANDNIINQFRDKFITSLSTFDSFVVIPLENSSPLENQSNKGNKFKSPKVFDINGDEGYIKGVSNEYFLFLYDNILDLNLFLQKNIKSNLTCFCLGININFFETKKWIKNNGLFNKKNFFFYFITNISENITNIKFYNLPRIVIINSDNEIIEDKSIKNLQNFHIDGDLVSSNSNRYRSEDNKKEESNFIFLENDNKRKIIKAINNYLKSAGLNNVNFYVKSKISFDKKGIRKIRCYPVFYGEATKIEKKMVDNLVKTLNRQELFRDVQNKVNYQYSK